MIGKREFMIVFTTALMLFVMTNIGIGHAIPDPPDGYSADQDTVGEWNWNVRASVNGHWVWVETPHLHRVFDEEHYSADRWAWMGVWVDMYLTLWYGYDGNTVNASVMHPSTHLPKDLYVECNQAHALARSGFLNILGQYWESETRQVQIGG
jgi:hypothetical protein